MLVSVFTWFENYPRQIYLTLSAIEKLLDIDDDRLMIDISINGAFIKSGLYEQLTKLVNHKESAISNLAGKLLDDISDNTRDNTINNI
jgi:hypothetical protein